MSKLLMSEVWEEKERQLTRYASAKYLIGHPQDKTLNRRIENLRIAKETCRKLETLGDAG